MKIAQQDRREQINVLIAQANDAKAQIANMEAALASKRQDLQSKLAKKVELELEYERTAIEKESVIKDLNKLAESKKRLFKDLSAEAKNEPFSNSESEHEGGTDPYLTLCFAACILGSTFISDRIHESPKGSSVLYAIFRPGSL